MLLSSLKKTLIVSLVLLLLGMGSVYGSGELRDLAANGVETQGTVLSITKRHRSARKRTSTRYTAELEIEGLPGVRSRTISKSRSRELEEGQQVPVVYSSSNPSNFILGTREDAVERGSWARYVLLLGWALIAAGVLCAAFAARVVLLA